MEDRRERGHIVVGVDGSTGSEHALQWAVDDAHARHLDVDVVHAWSQPVSVYPADLYAEPDAHRTAGARLLAHALTTVDDADADTRIASRLVQEDAASALLEAAADAELLVVGTRGRGGFTGLLLGSVSRTCLHLAAVPLVVVPPTWTRRGDPSHRRRRRRLGTVPRGPRLGGGRGRDPTVPASRSSTSTTSRR